MGDKALDALIATPKNVVTETKRQMENDVVFSTQKGEWIDKEVGYLHIDDAIMSLTEKTTH